MEYELVPRFPAHVKAVCDYHDAGDDFRADEDREVVDMERPAQVCEETRYASHPVTAAARGNMNVFVKTSFLTTKSSGFTSVYIMASSTRSDTAIT